jgi:hypothetical protein
MFMVPEASMSAPAELSKSSVTVLPGAEPTFNGSAARFMTVPSVSGRLTATAMLLDVRLKPGIPVTEAAVAEALSAVYFLDLSDRFWAMASPNSTPVSASPFAFAVPPLTPTKAERLAAADGEQVNGNV